MGDLSFFSRFGFTEEDRANCHEILRRMLPEHELMTHKYQGYCSYTVLLFRQSGPNRELQIEQEAFDNDRDDFWNQSLVVQFRPPPFALDIQTASLARAIYGVFAPRVRSLGHFAARTHHRDDAHSRQLIGHAGDTSILTMTAQTLIPGLPYSAIQPHVPHLSPAQRARQEALVTDFAAFLARGWRRHSDSDNELQLPLHPGPLNAATPRKLRQLSLHLPSRRLRSAARGTLAALPLLRLLPLALNHGDVVPGNVMVAQQRDRGALAGLVDWAEAEVGAWGVPLYGLEFLLGFTIDIDSTAAWRWTYYSCAGELRRLFWREIERRIPSLIQAIRVARAVGVLLWFGFAWEEGRIDRVVDRVRDQREVLLLETFLGVGGEGRRRDRWEGVGKL
ncbi:hypothetical protein BKA80DRAFT_240178 [Phyllosticta citrichinensis]